ncbi:DMT family transporter [bacterium]|jgi:drug/metabolite transporter (DMT)-like permease|nr:DMT family transporter [bacterium]MBT3580921.1 DMT family transporter [bacterium]MBT4552250.1 DMT family transporter [bacterium]MBT7087712.1 DMT family transporter [bacterium]
MTWFSYAILALFCYGIQNFLFKVSAENKYNSAITTFAFFVTVTIISSFLILISDTRITHIYQLLFWAFLNASCFSIFTITKIEALKHVAASLAYPLIRLSTVVVILFSLVYFQDKLNPWQISGLILSVGAMALLTKKDTTDTNPRPNFNLGLLLVFISLFFGALSAIFAKFAAMQVNLLGFIALSYCFNTIFALGMVRKMQGINETKAFYPALKLGVLIGTVNFVGFYSLLKAFASGPLSIVASVHSFSSVIAIILIVLIYKEKIHFKRGLGIFLAILAIVLMKI